MDQIEIDAKKYLSVIEKLNASAFADLFRQKTIHATIMPVLLCVCRVLGFKATERSAYTVMETQVQQMGVPSFLQLMNDLHADAISAAVFKELQNLVGSEERAFNADCKKMQDTSLLALCLLGWLRGVYLSSIVDTFRKSESGSPSQKDRASPSSLASPAYCEADQDDADYDGPLEF